MIGRGKCFKLFKLFLTLGQKAINIHVVPYENKFTDV